MPGSTRTVWRAVLDFIATGGYALRAYDKFKRHRPRRRRHAGGVTHPRIVQQHRMNAGIIVDAPMIEVRFRNGRKLGTVEEQFRRDAAPGDTFFFAGLDLEVERIDGHST